VSLIDKLRNQAFPSQRSLNFVHNRRETAPIDGESSIRPPDIDSFGGIKCNAAEDSRSHTELTHSQCLWQPDEVNSHIVLGFELTNGE